MIGRGEAAHRTAAPAPAPAAAAPTTAPAPAGTGPAAALQVGAVALSLVAPAIVRRAGRGRRAGLKRALATGAVIAAGNAATALAERRHPYREDWSAGRPGDLPTDLAYVAVQAPIVTVGNAVVEAAAIPLAVAALQRTTTARWPEELPLPVRLSMALVLAELPHYWWHRYSHGPGWRWHEAHHSTTRLYWFNATRAHVVDMAVDLFLLSLPLRALGADDDTMVAWQVFRGTYGKLQHANVAGSSGALNAVLSTPDHHRWHHSRDPEVGASNFGANLIIWDRVFGTRLLPPEPFAEEIGPEAGSGVPRSWWGQALRPLRRR